MKKTDSKKREGGRSSVPVSLSDDESWEMEWTDRFDPRGQALRDAQRAFERYEQELTELGNAE